MKLMILLIFCVVNIHANTFDEEGFPFHGTFCGKDIPNIRAASKEEELKLFEERIPLDEIDQACKNHDICYLKNGMYNKKCDELLVKEISAVRPRVKHTDCAQLCSVISLFFIKKHNNSLALLSDEDKTVGEKALLLPFQLIGDALTVTLFSMGVVASYTIYMSYNIGNNK